MTEHVIDLLPEQPQKPTLTIRQEGRLVLEVSVVIPPHARPGDVLSLRCPLAFAYQQADGDAP